MPGERGLWWNHASVHVQVWPQPTGSGGDKALIDPTLELLAHIRRAKTEAKASQRAEVVSLLVSAPPHLHDALSAGRDDLLEAGSILQLSARTADQLSCEIELASST